MKALVESEALNVVNAAKSWHRADDSNREKRERRLHQMVERYLKVEGERTAKAKDRNRHAVAAEQNVWLDGDGKPTPYMELEGKHLYNIRKKLRVDADSYEGICSEIERRAPGADVLWATGIPFRYVTTVQNGDQAKVSFRNVLTNKMESIEVDRDGFVIAWSGYMHHGLSGDQARALYDAWQASGVKADDADVG